MTKSICLLGIAAFIVYWCFYRKGCGGCAGKPKLSLVRDDVQRSPVGGAPPAGLPGASGPKGRLEELGGNGSSPFLTTARMGPPPGNK